MKNKLLISGVVSSVLLGSLLVPSTSQAFWPFDKWFQDDKVMGETTDAPKKTIRSFFTRTTPTPAPTKTDRPEIEDALDEERLSALVRGNVISEAQKNQILSRLRVIKAKKAELKKLQDAFKVWLRENKIDPKVLMGEVSTPSGSPKRNKPTITTQNDDDDDDVDKTETE